MNPFSEKYDLDDERRLVTEAQEGSQKALEKLIKLHQRFIYNVALKLVRNPADAADLSQEAIIKMITKLNLFKGKSSFRTWLYKIVMNHFINSGKRKSELEIKSFEKYGQFLDNVFISEEMTFAEHQKYQDEITYVRNNCMTSMLLCLDRQQRIIFILGSIFNIKSGIASRLLNITAENFRQQLSRAKADLFSFMENKCGLINPDNPCRCTKKTKGFMKEGLIDQSKNQFKKNVVKQIHDIAVENNKKLDHLMEGRYLTFFRHQPYEDKELTQELIKTLLFNKDIIDLFRLN
ncbi:MAG TPA: RNA polymerase sigma factor [Puia sp.]|nr:RNA polymerase sigma factor [Puia sp.]